MTLNLDRSTWKRVSFGDIIENVTDRVNDPSTAGVDRYVGLEHLDPGVLTVQRWDSPDKVQAQKLRFYPGDVIFGRRRAYQKKVAMAEFEGICSAHALVLRAKHGRIDPDFLPVFLSSDYFLDRAISISVGSLSPTVNWRDLTVEQFDLPPLDEQQRIADVLWVIERHRMCLDQFRCASITVTHGWLERTYAGISDHQPLSDGVAASAYGPRFSNSLYSDSADYRLLRTTDMDVDGNVDYSTMPRANLDGSFDPHLLQDGDFLISRSGTCGVPAVFDATRGGDMVIPGAFLIRLRLNKDLDPHFLRAFFNSRPGRELSASLAQGGVQKNIRGSSLLEAHVPFPSKAEQREILELLAGMERATETIDAEADKVSALRSSLLADIFGAG